MLYNFIPYAMYYYAEKKNHGKDTFVNAYDKKVCKPSSYKRLCLVKKVNKVQWKRINTAKHSVMNVFYSKNGTIIMHNGKRVERGTKI